MGVVKRGERFKGEVGGQSARVKGVSMQECVKMCEGGGAWKMFYLDSLAGGVEDEFLNRDSQILTLLSSCSGADKRIVYQLNVFQFSQKVYRPYTLTASHIQSRKSFSFFSLLFRLSLCFLLQILSAHWDSSVTSTALTTPVK